MFGWFRLGGFICLALPQWVLLVTSILAEGETVNPEQRTDLRGCRSTSGKRL